MQFNLSLSDKLKARLGHVAVAGLLALVYWATYGCGDGRSKEQPTQESSVGQVVQHVVPSTPAAIEPEPVQSVSSVPRAVTFEEADSAYRDKRYGEAVSLFTAYTEVKPANAWGHYMLGLSALKAGDHDTAEGAFERALERDPEHVKSLLNLSRVYLDTDRVEGAIQRIQEALLIDSESSDAFRLLGRARHQLGLVEEAIDAFWEAVVLDNRDAWSMNNLGFVLIQEGRFEEALPPLARATELRSDVALFHNNLGIALERTGHFSAATTAFRAALGADSTYEKSAVNLARVEGLEQDPTDRPVDLTALALRFADELERFRQPVTAEVPPEMVAPDSTEIPEENPEHPIEPPKQ
jgi:Flp pilus assembly protein TadD